MKTMRIFIVVTALFFTAAHHGQNSSLFDQGNAAYRNGNYQEAIQLWEEILDSGYTSSDVYYNLGNAYYRLNQIGPGIYYYEKALQLAPDDPDIKNNLRFAENARIDIIEPLPQSVFSRWYQGVTGLFSYDGWAVLAVIASAGFALFFLLYYFSFSEKRKRFFFTISLIAALVLVTTVSLAFLTYEDFRRNRFAIVFADQLEVKSEPSLAGQAAFVIHSGTKVRIKSEADTWLRIVLADGKDGWVPASKVKQL